MEGTTVDAPHLDAHREDNSLTQWDEIPWVTTPVDVGGLADSLLRVSIRSPPRGTLESPATSVSHEVDELDMGPCWCLYCLQLDVAMVQDPLRPPPPQHSWTVATIRDMVAGDAPNIKDCIILSPGSVILSFSHYQEPQEGLYLHDAQELAEEIMKTTTWLGQPMHQQVFPITIAEGWWAISMSHRMSKHWYCQFPMEMVHRTDWEAEPTSSWTDEDEDRDTHASSPTLVSFVGRRRCSQGWCWSWMPLPHFPGLGHNMNPIPYPPLMNFPPPPIVAPIPLGFPSSILYASSSNCCPLNTSPIHNAGCCSTCTG